MDFLVKTFDQVVRLIDGVSETSGFTLPPGDLVELSGSSTEFRLDLLAGLALVPDSIGCHDEFHTARFSGAILSVAVLSEVSPLPVAAGEDVLLVEAHGGEDECC